jgi:outer membrane lipoprotein-sorting protein
MKRYILLFCVLVVPVFNGTAEQDFQKILKEIYDKKSFMETDFSCTNTIVWEKPGEETTLRQAKVFRRDGEDKFVLLILKPQTQKGQGYLQAEGNMWFYDPESRKFAHTSLKDTFQDSDARNSDFRKSSLSKDYEVTGHTEDKLGRYEVYILDLAATNDEVTYPFLRLWVRKEGHLILKCENYSLAKRLLRTDLFPKYAKVRDKIIPTKMLFIDALTEGKKTQISLKDISLAHLPDSVFTKSYIERVNR